MMIDMSMSAEEAKEQYGNDTKDAPKYPYGLRISLNDDDLAKLGITSLPAVGTKMVITCQTEVCSTGVYEDQSKEKEASMSLQIQAMEIGEDKDSSDAATLLYGS